MKLPTKLKRVLLLSWLIVLVATAAAWWYHATQAETLRTIKIPRSLTWAAARYYGSKQAEFLQHLPKTDIWCAHIYSISIHKSQIRPWGTLWRAEYHVKWVNGDVEIVGFETHTPMGTGILKWKPAELPLKLP